MARDLDDLDFESMVRLGEAYASRGPDGVDGLVNLIRTACRRAGTAAKGVHRLQDLQAKESSGPGFDEDHSVYLGRLEGDASAWVIQARETAHALARQLADVDGAAAIEVLAEIARGEAAALNDEGAPLAGTREWAVHVLVEKTQESPVRKVVRSPPLACCGDDNTVFENRSQARMTVFDFIERFYDPRRRHSSLGNLSPAAYERRWQDQAEAA